MYFDRILVFITFYDIEHVWFCRSLIQAVSESPFLCGYAFFKLFESRDKLIFHTFFDGQFGNVSFAFVHAPILGVLLAVVGMVGDLFESLIKRTAGVKDSGNAIPGMGGVLDVLDSLLFGVPVLYVYLTFVV